MCYAWSDEPRSIRTARSVKLWWEGEDRASLRGGAPPPYYTKGVGVLGDAQTAGCPRSGGICHGCFAWSAEACSSRTLRFALLERTLRPTTPNTHEWWRINGIARESLNMPTPTTRNPNNEASHSYDGPLGYCAWGYSVTGCSAAFAVATPMKIRTGSRLWAGL